MILRPSCLAIVLVIWMAAPCLSQEDHTHFEQKIRPLLVDHCLKCHGASRQEGGLRLDSAESLRAGGDSGEVVDRANWESGLLWARVSAGEMPPRTEPKLSSTQIDALKSWLQSGAAFPQRSLVGEEARNWTRLWSFQPLGRAQAREALPEPHRAMIDPTSARNPDVAPAEPDSEPLRSALEAWYRASDLVVAGIKDDADVELWPDRSGHERHLQATKLGHVAGKGGAATLVHRSTVHGEPALRFDEQTGLGSPGSNPVPVFGDAPFTLAVVLNLRPRHGGYQHDMIVSFGEFGGSPDPGRARAGALGIQRVAGANHCLAVVGGWGHDARFPSGSFAPLYHESCLITLVKQPGPIASTARVYVNGELAETMLGPQTGRDLAPDYRERLAKDFSIMMGSAVDGAGAILGDVSELVVYSRALSDEERRGVEAALVDRYRLESMPERIRQWTSSARPESDGRAAATAVHPIDAFIDSRLQAAALEPAPRADRRTLLRRASLDVIGLPPTPAQVEAFERDSSPMAWVTAVTELLASPQYGERWGRHWLDVARYADSGGYETDILYRQAWRYRDYVVRSLNQDKAWDRFVQEQIAGDELWPDNLDTFGPVPMSRAKERALEAHVGTGVFVLGPQIHESNADANLREYERLTDQVDLFGSAFLGLTFGCARCHDHKFDPLTQRDYFSLQAVFSHSREAERPLGTASDLADLRQNYPRLQAVVRAKRAYRLLEQSLSGRTATPEEEQRRQQLLAEIGQRVLEIPESSAQKRQYEGLLEMPTALVLEHQRPELVKPVRLLERGELSMPRDVVTAALPASLAEATHSAKDLPNGLTSRKALALWLTRPDHPLTARLIVNRVWQWHFGTGLVSTPNDFGRMGQPPSHPELLDWLALDFMEHGWSLKRLHKLIMTSEAYQRDSRFATARHMEVDPDNRLLWRFNRRRLEGEAIWDSMHAVAGTLNLDMEGPPVTPPLTAEERASLREPFRWQESPDPRQNARRGLYVITYRNFRFPFFEIFDAPNSAMSVGARDVSTVAPQALWLLNHPIAWEQARKLAERVQRESPGDASGQIRAAWRLGLGRPPTDRELSAALQIVESPAAQQPESMTRLARVCLSLFNHNEFLFVD